MQRSGGSNLTLKHYKNHRERDYFYVFRNFDGLFCWVTVNESRQAMQVDQTTTNIWSRWISQPPRAAEMVEQISGTFYTLVHKQSVKESHFSDVCVLPSWRHFELSQMRFARKSFLISTESDCQHKVREHQVKNNGSFKKNRADCGLCTTTA